MSQRDPLHTPPRASFTITRKPGTDELVFDPPKGTDEHFDALELLSARENHPPDGGDVRSLTFTFAKRKRTISKAVLSHRKAATSIQHGTSPSSSWSDSHPTHGKCRTLLAARESKVPSFILQSVYQPPKRKHSDIEQATANSSTSQFHKFRLVDTNKPKAKERKQKVQQQRDIYGNLKQACTIHHRKKRRVC